MEHAPTILAELEDYLKNENLTLALFAERSGVHPRTLSNLRNRYRPIAVQQLDQITRGMGLQEGFFYDLYIDNFIIDRAPDWRRIEPLLYRCAEMDKLQQIGRVVQHIMEKLMYAPMLFNVAEELLSRGHQDAAMLLYESVAEGERFQHSERLALCQYRLFKLKLGENQEQNLQAAIQFEPFVRRLDDIEQLDGLKDLANAYRALRRWDQVMKVAEEMGNLARIQYSMINYAEQVKLKNPLRPVFIYAAYSSLLIASVHYERKNYNLSLQHIEDYARLDWVKETDTDTMYWKNQFQEWAEANNYLTKLMAGQIELLPDYINFIRNKKEEILPALWNIMIVANQYDVNVDSIIDTFNNEILHIHKQEGNEVYNQQDTSDQIVGLLFELAHYYLTKKNYTKGFEFLMDVMEKCTIINNESTLLKSMKLFESYRKVASDEFKSKYHNLVEERGTYEEETRSIVGH